MIRLLTSRFLACLSLVALSLIGQTAQAQNAARSTYSTPQVQAELMAQAPEGIAPGQPLWVGLSLTHQPEWHTYWKNSGDSGLPTSLQWKLPPGITAGDIAWPVPQKIRIGTLANYGYEGKVLLPVPLSVAPNFKPPLLAKDLEIGLHAAWLVCRKECIPQEGDFSLHIPLHGSTALNAADFDAALAAQPKALAPESGHITVEDKLLKLRVDGLPADLQGKQLELFVETPEVIETAAAWTQAWDGAHWSASVPLAFQREASPTMMPVVLGAGHSFWRAEAPVSGTWPAVALATDSLPAPPTAAPRAAAAVPTSLWLALMGALVGGLLLNLMPCVFPVLAIKMVSFAQLAHSHQPRRALRQQGLAYTAGVLLSFLALGGLMLGLRLGGEQLGWGFQLQSPLMVAALALLFTLIALNLFGVFEFGMLLPSRLSSAQLRHPVGNALLSGLLTVAVASPCTAPFMGASLGLTLSLPGWQALLVFGALGLGMAMPYLLASLVPGVTRWMPRPGAWMDLFRRAMAFPMLGTVAWLVWVLGQQTGIDGAGALLVLLLLVSMLVWGLNLGGVARRVVGAVAALALLVSAVWLGPNLNNNAGAVERPALASGWQPWAADRVEQLQAQGQTVFVDFTAAWCVTCQFNRRTTLSNPQVLADLNAKRITLLHADWTRRDPAISAALTALGRSGVPVYAFYKPGQAPLLLSELPSVDEMRAAIAQM